jgi:uncharacterized protein (TIGR02246 family)
MTTAPRDEAVIRTVLDRWKDAIGRHEPERVASCFAEDAVFQALNPYSVGRAGVAEYYASRPRMTADYQILETRRFSEDLVLGYLNADFSFADRPTLHLKLGVLLKQGADGWEIGHYQVSKLD